MNRIKLRLVSLKHSQIVTILVLMVLFTFTGLEVNSQTKRKTAKNAPVFSNFIYEGSDQVYKDYPLVLLY